MSQEVLEAIKEVLNDIYMNPSQKGLTSTFFLRNGITWGDIVSYLTSVGVLGMAMGGVIKIKNFLKSKFSKNKEEEVKEKLENIEKIAKEITPMIISDPNSPLNKEKEPRQETPWERKERLQRKPDSGWKYKPKPFNPNQHRPWANEEESKEDENVKEVFKPAFLGQEIAILNSQDGMYVLYFDNIKDLDGSETIENIADYVNSNIDNLKIGKGVEDWKDESCDLIKLDEELKEKLVNLYKKDEELIKTLHKLEEMTTSASSGAFVGKMGMTQKKNITRGYTPADQITDMINDEELAIYEMTATGGPASPNSQGQYVQPKIWAKDEKNWRGAKKTLYPKGEMVKFDPCTKLNNNKKAQQGKCSQGAVDNVVKTYKTKGSVISSDAIYETIAKKTGKSVDEVKKIIESKKDNNESLSEK
jgi:hypothetical protein